MTHTRLWRQIRVGIVVADALVVVLTYILADYLRCRFYLRTDWPELMSNGESSVRVHIKVLVFLPIVWPAIMSQIRGYALRWQTWHEVLRNSVVASLLLGLFVAAAALIFERERFPRAQIAMLVALLPATTLIVRGITAWLALSAGRKQVRHVLVVGTNRGAVRLRRLVRHATFGRPRIIGHLSVPWDEQDERLFDSEILGDLSEFGAVLDQQIVDEVIFAVPIERISDILPLVRHCEEVGISATVNAESFGCLSVPEMVELHGVPMLTYLPVRHAPELLAIKRGMDISASIIGIAITGPIMLACALIIRVTSKGPILFRQPRSGLNGRPFTMYKFRTMDPDAEEKRATIAHLNESDGPVFKIKKDPRVTRIGRILRRWSLDELPQLFNVLKGDMAIVGPRPPIPAEVAQYDRWQRRRLSMRPGLTCLWQIKGRHRIGFEEWMRLDLYYIDNWSLSLDVLIICKTIPTVLGGTGA